MMNNELCNQTFDIDSILDVFQGECRQVRQFIELYIDHTPRYARELEEAIHRGDAAKAIRASHGIRGSAAMVGAERLQSLAESMETFSNAGDLDNARTMYESLVEEMDRLCHLLDEYASTLERTE